MKCFGRLAALWFLVFCISVALSAGCSSDETSSKINEAESDVAIEKDVYTSTDTDHQDVDKGKSDVIEKDDATADVELDEVGDTSDTSTGDTSTGDTSTGDQDIEEDTGIDTELDADENEETDVSKDDDPYKDRPLGQCNENLDCEIMAGGYRDCRSNIPGGVCGACGANDCGATAECFWGACQEDCKTKDDCAPGLTCTASKSCGAETCKDNICPTPMFGCSEPNTMGIQYCERIKCDKPSDCPTDTTCTKGLCIENRQL